MPDILPVVSKVKMASLRKEILPFGGVTMRSSGVSMVGNPDPVISFLSQRGEETYLVMERSETAIWNARQHVDTRILAAGSELLPGESRSPAARLLHEFGVEFLRRIPRWTEVQSRMLDAVYWGWRPMELLWEPGIGPQGRTRWFVSSAIEKGPQHFRFTQERELILFNGAEQRLLNTPEDKLAWLVCTYGSLDNPYGEALYQKIWLLWYAKQRFFQLWATGMERSMGLLHMERTGPEDLTQDASETWNAVKTDVQATLRRLKEAGVLVTMPGWKTNFLTDVDFSSGWQGVIDYCNREMATAVAGETLSFQEAEFGTRAQSQTHRQSGLDVARRRAKALEGWVNDGLLEPAFALNFGPVEAADRPKWRCLVGREADLDSAKQLFDMGARLDGRRLADASNVPLADDDLEDEDVLQKKEAPKAPPAMPGGQNPPRNPAEEGQEPPDNPDDPEDSSDPATRSARSTSAAAAAEAQEKAAAALVAAAITAAGPLFEQRISSLVDEYLKANPDPFV